MFSQDIGRLQYGGCTNPCCNQRISFSLLFLLLFFFLPQASAPTCKQAHDLRSPRTAYCVKRADRLFLFCSSVSPPVSTILLSHSLHGLSHNPESTWWDQRCSQESNMFTGTGTSLILNSIKSLASVALVSDLVLICRQQRRLKCQRRAV